MRYYVTDHRHAGRRIIHPGSGADMSRALHEHAQEASPARWDDGTWTATDGAWILDIDACTGRCMRVAK